MIARGDKPAELTTDDADRLRNIAAGIEHFAPWVEYERDVQYLRLLAEAAELKEGER